VKGLSTELKQFEFADCLGSNRQNDSRPAESRQKNKHSRNRGKNVALAGKEW
jgi:hypothetical protein